MSFLRRKKQTVYTTAMLENGFSRQGQGARLIHYHNESYPWDAYHLAREIQQMS